MIHAPVTDGQRPAYFGLYPAIVTGLVDPDKLGRIQVKFPWLSIEDENEVRSWATLLSTYADHNQGFQFLHEVDSQVIVGIEAFHPRRPYIDGACRQGK